MPLSHDVIAGGTAGCLSRLASAPFDLIKIRFQLQSSKASSYYSVREAFHSIIAKEGFGYI